MELVERRMKLANGPVPVSGLFESVGVFLGRVSPFLSALVYTRSWHYPVHWFPSCCNTSAQKAEWSNRAGGSRAQVHRTAFSFRDVATVPPSLLPLSLLFSCFCLISSSAVFRPLQFLHSLSPLLLSLCVNPLETKNYFKDDPQERKFVFLC